MNSNVATDGLIGGSGRSSEANEAARRFTGRGVGVTSFVVSGRSALCQLLRKSVISSPMSVK